MKTFMYCFVLIFILIGCKQANKPEVFALRDGFYPVIKADTSYTFLNDSIRAGQVIVDFDTLFNPGDYTKVLIDTTDFVGLDLETAPTTQDQTENKKLLSISLSPKMAEKMQVFTAKRVMKQVAIILDGKAVTMHKIREAITGNKMQITRCDDNGCQYLYTKMKDRVRK